MANRGRHARARVSGRPTPRAPGRPGECCPAFLGCVAGLRGPTTSSRGRSSTPLLSTLCLELPAPRDGSAYRWPTAPWCAGSWATATTATRGGPARAASRPWPVGGAGGEPSPKPGTRPGHSRSSSLSCRSGRTVAVEGGVRLAGGWWWSDGPSGSGARGSYCLREATARCRGATARSAVGSRPPSLASAGFRPAGRVEPDM